MKFLFRYTLSLKKKGYIFCLVFHPVKEGLAECEKILAPSRKYRILHFLYFFPLLSRQRLTICHPHVWRIVYKGGTCVLLLALRQAAQCLLSLLIATRGESIPRLAQTANTITSSSSSSCKEEEVLLLTAMDTLR